jgi:DNA-binding transcriptional regulator YhcF (GntR family)
VKTLELDIDRNADTPVYRQLAEQIQNWIESREGPDPGDQIPSESAIAEAVDVSRMTVRQALGELRAAGLLDAQQGRGVFVVAPPWYTSMDELNCFAHVLIDSDRIDADQCKDLIYYYEKPWKWDREHQVWRALGEPMEPSRADSPKTYAADCKAWDELLEAFAALDNDDDRM